MYLPVPSDYRLSLSLRYVNMIIHLRRKLKQSNKVYASGNPQSSFSSYFVR